ncbi:MAG TPA: amidohydrolase [Terriglobales bacterium]|nr:amidohydrolase [Terriglobales bacterium]
MNAMKTRLVIALIYLAFVLCFATGLLAQTPAGSKASPSKTKAQAGISIPNLQTVLPEIEQLYLDLHQNPELSLQESNTSAKLADRMRKLGYEVTAGFGGTGVVAVLRNGQGPTVLFRTDMDALPVAEETGLPYASRVRVKNASGAEIPVMHACGHDIHMSAWIGTATLMAQAKDRWRGTLVMVAQPAEEIVKGARAMLDAGLYTKFPKPDFALAIHDAADLPVGTIGFTSGPALAGADTVDITIFGRGGHGAMPHTTVDPIVIAARTVLAIQTIVSREKDPREPGVITIGRITGGTKHNIVPDEVHLALSVRSFKPEVRKQLLTAIERVTRAEAEAGGSPKPPVFHYPETTTPTYNDPKLTARVVGALRSTLGEDRVLEKPPLMVSEDFAAYSRGGVPIFLFHVGAVEPSKYQQAMSTGANLPSLHSSTFAPEYKGTLRTAITAEFSALMELLQPK